jgi:hypothetical protein
MIAYYSEDHVLACLVQRHMSIACASILNTTCTCLEEIISLCVRVLGIDSHRFKPSFRINLGFEVENRIASSHYYS